ncbi:transmembrane protein 267-like [Argiope bruennichi]|uniref:transmembrane protein 267-like n=1 Tax=Argiope bruennichi TaxID=94029 RepID=UPI0024946131|nr:transmembrane protein 267-like [Argiope bruennichi]
MNLIFYAKQILYILCLLAVSHYADSLINLEVIHKDISLRCVTDNLTHMCIGIISWLIVCSYDSFTTNHIYQSLLCGLFAGLVDLDHFLMAKSLKFKDAINLSSRPPFHNTTFVAMFAVSLILVMHFKGNELFENIGWYILVAAISHHLRDAQRRGLWLWPCVTKPLNYSNYLILTYLFPLAIGSLLKVLNKNTLKGKKQDILFV